MPVCAAGKDGYKIHFSLRRHYPVQVIRVLSQPLYKKHPGNSDDEKERVFHKGSTVCNYFSGIM